MQERERNCTRRNRKRSSRLRTRRIAAVHLQWRLSLIHIFLEVSADKLGLPEVGIIDVLNVKSDPLLIGSLRRQDGYFPVSYTHLDVYKRQQQHNLQEIVLFLTCAYMLLKMLLSKPYPILKGIIAKLSLRCLLYTSRCV